VTARPGQFTALQLLDFMAEAIARIREDTAELSRDEFFTDSKAARQLRDAAVLNIGVLGEAAGDLAAHHPDFVLNHPDIPLRDIKDMRNRLFHGYHSVNMDIVWSSCKKDIPALEVLIERARTELASQGL